MVKIRLDPGSPVGSRNTNDATALQEAARKRHDKVITVLLENSTDVNASRGASEVH